MDLTTLTADQLEDLENSANLSGHDDLHDLVIAEMLRRPDFCPSSYELQYYLEDLGWNGGVDQDARDAR
jgi:hypothetical protein